MTHLNYPIQCAWQQNHHSLVTRPRRGIVYLNPTQGPCVFQPTQGPCMLPPSLGSPNYPNFMRQNYRLKIMHRHSNRHKGNRQAYDQIIKLDTDSLKPGSKIICIQITKNQTRGHEHLVLWSSQSSTGSSTIRHHP